jgi:hydrogenase maturation factor
MTRSHQRATELQVPVDHGAGCVTCGDIATWVRVVEVDRGRDIAICVHEGGPDHTVDTGIVGAVAPGDRLLVHAGTALRKESA